MLRAGGFHVNDPHTRHLIADNLGWFKNQDGSEGGKTVEDFVRAKGETVKRGTLSQTAEGDIEFVP